MRDLLYVLPALACPVGMGLMMWLMMRPNRNSQPKTGQATPYATPTGQRQSEQEAAALRKEIAELRAELEDRPVRTPAAERTP